MQHERADYNERIQDNAVLIPDDEPVFLIRGRDVVAYDTLIAYAAYNERAGGNKDLSDRVRAHAFTMKKWPVKKLADAPEDEEAKAPKDAEHVKRPTKGTQVSKPRKQKGDGK